MDNYIKDFCLYIASEKGLSLNTINAYETDLYAFISYLKSQDIEKIASVKQESIINYLALLQKKKYATSSIARALIAIKVFFRFLKRERVLDQNISIYIDSPKLWQLIPEVLTCKEVDKLLAQPDKNTHLGARDLAILEVIYGSGLRVSELCNLKLYDIDDAFVKVFGKGRKERIVPVGKKAIAAVDHYLLYYRCNFDSETLQFLFLSERGKQINRISVWNMIKRYAKEAGISKSISPHTLRHSFATHLLDNDAELRVIQEMMGHTCLSSTGRYLHISKTKVQEAFYNFHPKL